MSCRWEAGSPGLQAVVSSEIPGRNLSWTEPTEHLASPGGTKKKCKKYILKGTFSDKQKKNTNLYVYSFNFYGILVFIDSDKRMTGYMGGERERQGATCNKGSDPNWKCYNYMACALTIQLQKCSRYTLNILQLHNRLTWMGVYHLLCCGGRRGGFRGLGS